MDALTLWMAVGFLFAGYAVIANDSVQTLGTWIASNNDKFNWKVMWGAASAVLLYTLWYGWYTNGGDISYGRLNKIPFQEIQWYHAMAPGLLLVLTRIGVPVSTSFLVLSAFASTFVLEKMLVKSMMGYAVAAVAAYVIWIGVTKLLDESKPVKEEHKKWWRIGQWVTTGFLWFTWLSHDMANIAVFLPREIPWDLMIAISLVFVLGLGFMFREGGGKIRVRTNHHQHRTVEIWTGDTLEIHRVRREDMGAYLCIASNDVPPAVSKRIYLHVQCESVS